MKYQEDGSGGQEFKYGNMGEMTEIRRTLVIPNQAVATYVTDWTYDSWNRLRTMTYPDGEMLSYGYNAAGLLTKVSGNVTNKFYVNDYNYVDSIYYDKFEQRTRLRYGNGTVTNYAYNDSNRVLKTLSVQSLNISQKPYLMNNAYAYDPVKNITQVMNTGTAVNAPTTIGGTIGGGMEHNYVYDDLYRLKEAHGDFNKNQTKTAHYDLIMGYDNLHNITSKTQKISQANVQFAGALNAEYDLKYTYNANNPQQISNIADSSYRTEGTGANKPINKVQQYSYDANGNLLSVQTSSLSGAGGNNRKLLWDEENRLSALSDNGYVSNYFYDAAGERTVKESGDAEAVSINGVVSGARTGTTNFTAYVSPYTVIGNGGQMSKHIYIGSQRIVSKLCNSGIMSDPTQAVKATYTGNTLNYSTKYANLTAKIKTRYDSLGVTYKGKDNAGTGFYTARGPVVRDSLMYYFHSDHLGSSSLITDVSGNVVQHLEYIPFGEVFIDERPSAGSWSTPYKFNAKELDEETGLYYYGARYYDPRSSVWLSVDPLAEKYPNMSSYVYCHNNPVNMIDPDGKGDYYASDGTRLGNDGNDDHKAYLVSGFTSKNTPIEGQFTQAELGTMRDGTNATLKANDIGITNEELNTRSTLSTLKQAEAGSSNHPLDYNSWFGTGEVFTKDTYEDNPQAYSKHPGYNKKHGGSAAGAYQFLERFYEEKDFSPQSQDKAALKLMGKNGRNAAKTGDIEKFKSLLSGKWTSLSYWTNKNLKNVFKKNLSRELLNKSDIGTPRGKLTQSQSK